jgi:hypothetical protein
MVNTTESSGALEGAVNALVSLRDHLQQMHGNRHRFSRTSANQADAAYDKFKTSGTIDTTDFVVTLFANAQHVRQFQVTVFVTSGVIRKQIDAIEDSHRRGDLTGLLGQLRFLIERFGHLHFLSKNIAKTLSAPHNAASHPFISSLDIDKDVKNALYGTTLKWNDVAQKTLAEIDLKSDLGRNLKDELGNYFATQVLNKVDRLDKSCPGTRAAYEILCDFLHPNVGDLFASTTSYSEFNDRFGVQHIVRNIALDERADLGHTADRVVLDKIYAHFANLVSLCIGDFVACEQLDRSLSEHLSSYTRAILKKNRKLFQKSDLCPCASGELIFRCCGRTMTSNVKG